jgi:hypothetical protein
MSERKGVMGGTETWKAETDGDFYSSNVYISLVFGVVGDGTGLVDEQQARTMRASSGS